MGSRLPASKLTDGTAVCCSATLILVPIPRSSKPLKLPGVGAFGVTVMTLCGRPIHQAVATASGFGAAIALPAALINVGTGWGTDGLPPFSAGYVNLPGFVILGVLTSVTAPYGARLAHRLDRARLKQFFAIFLAATALNLLWEAVR